MPDTTKPGTLTLDYLRQEPNERGSYNFSGDAVRSMRADVEALGHALKRADDEVEIMRPQAEHLADAVAKCNRNAEKLMVAEANVARLREALGKVLDLIDTHWLVRNVDKDHEPGWAFKQVEPVKRLTEARAALAATGKDGDK